MTNKTGAASKQTTLIPAFNNKTPSPRRRIRQAPDGRTADLKSADACRRRINGGDLKPLGRWLPPDRSVSSGADPARSLRESDLAFQHAMRRAIAQGLEQPPRLGVVKDRRPLTAPRLFEPVPHASGCTSPALACAELAAPDD